MKIRFTLVIMMMISILIGSCSSRIRKLNRKGLIPDKDLVSIIKDVYIADGILSLPYVHSKYANVDSLSVYTSIIEKHGYTKENMDKTMKYYFIKDPKKLIAIYDQVLGIYSGQESILDKEILLAQKKIYNTWPGKEFYAYAGTDTKDSSGFSINLYSQGVYLFTYTATFYPDDESVNPGTTMYSLKPDSLETGKRNYFRTMSYLKDGRPHNYSYTFKTTEKSIIHLKGQLYDSENNKPGLEKHALFENLSVVFSPVAR